MVQAVKTIPQPKRGTAGSTDPGPRNVELDRQNPDVFVPPPTDAGTVPNLKFSFSMAHNRLEEGGWAREVTRRELPIATEMAGVDMRLEPGAYRELHWHKQSEWAYVLDGSCRISAVDQEGRRFLDDVRKGDLWFFPKGVPHHIQALDEGVEFLLVFDDGAFSENSTFLMSDWFAHTPKDVLAKNFGWTLQDLDDIPEREKYIFRGQVPPPLESDKVVSPTGDVPRTFKHRMHAQEPQRFSRRYGPDRRPDQLRGRQHDLRRAGRGRAGWTAGTALAPERRRVAVLHQRVRPDGRVRQLGSRPDVQLSGRRRGIRPLRIRPLHREPR
jgi:oxalate decarboxylase